MEPEQTQIIFSAYQQPALPVGEYKITATQRLIKTPFKIAADLLNKPDDKELSTAIKNKLRNIDQAFMSEEELLTALKTALTPTELEQCQEKIFGYISEILITPGNHKTFFVAGERFRIAPGEIGGVFPPVYSLGEHANVFPHVMITRSTLPWERKTSPADTITPWLGLLMIYEDETASVKTTLEKLGDYKTQLKITDPLEPGQADTDTVQLLQIKKEFLEKIIPGKNDLRWLTHVRQGERTAGKKAAEGMAVLIANRLPKKGGSSTVYLVSFENPYEEGGSFDYKAVNKDGFISLVQLHSWSFTCTQHFKISQNFLNAANDLDAGIKEKLKRIIGKEFFTEKDLLKSLTEEAQLTTDEVNTNKEKLVRDFAYGNFANILKHLDRTPATIRLSDDKLPSGNSNLKYLQSGFYPLPHQLRQGAQTVSWYHSPLAPAANTQPLPGPVTCADSLLQYHRENGMFDVSYAAAWELGRLLALQNANFSIELYRWKKQYARSNRKAAQLLAIPHLPGANSDNSPAPAPKQIHSWLQNLALLKGVPFNYLVPDEELLPVESIRFFKLDKAWIHALLDGALSIGRVTGKDLELDKKIIAEEAWLSGKEISGFIMRSEVVAGWPDLQPEAYNTTLTAGVTPDNGQLNLPRDEKLSGNVRICFFEGDLKTLLLHLKPEVLHFGVDGNEVDGFTKKWRDELTGQEDNNTIITVPVTKEGTTGVLNITSLLAGYTNNSKPILSSAHLAIQLLEGVERVCFEV